MKGGNGPDNPAGPRPGVTGAPILVSINLVPNGPAPDAILAALHATGAFSSVEVEYEGVRQIGYAIGGASLDDTEQALGSVEADGLFLSVLGRSPTPRPALVVGMTRSRRRTRTALLSDQPSPLRWIPAPRRETDRRTASPIDRNATSSKIIDALAGAQEDPLQGAAHGPPPGWSAMWSRTISALDRMDPYAERVLARLKPDGLSEQTVPVGLPDLRVTVRAAMNAWANALAGGLGALDRILTATFRPATGGDLGDRDRR